MLSEEALEKVVERLANRIEQGNEYILGQIGNKIDEIGKLQPTQAQQLEQMIRYGGDYDKIVKKLAEITKLNKRDIEKIFEEVAKKDYQFAEQFYKYRNKKYIPFDENAPLKKEVEALAKITNDKYTELARSKALGFSVRDKKGNVLFKGLKETYNDAIDKAVLSVSQGKTTFQEEMYAILKEIGMSGVKTLDFKGRAMRLDSAIRMHMKDALRQLHNELNIKFGEEFGADGVELSVHANPAPDHALAQGRQFSTRPVPGYEKGDWQKLQETGIAYTYDGIKIDLHRKLKSGETAEGFRQIGQYNCYHDVYSVVLGISEPEYSDEELQKIIDDNEKGFEFDGKHYTNYEGTQLQRRIETEVRRQKDLQMLGRASGNQKLAEESQLKINLLTKKYNKLCKESGLPSYTERMRVSGFHPIKVKNAVQKTTKTRIEKPKDGQASVPIASNSVKWLSDSEDFDFGEVFGVVSRDLEDKNVSIDSSIYRVHNRLITKNMEQLYILTDKYPHDAYFDKPLKLETFPSKGRTYGKAFYKEHTIKLANNYYSDPVLFKQKQLEDIKSKWHYKVSDDDLDIYTITHEYGHIIEYNYLEKQRLYANKVGKRFDYKVADKELRDTIVSNAMNKLDEKITTTEFKNRYFSNYAKSKKNYEWFAELFAKAELGEQDVFTEAFKEWLGGFYE